MDALCDLVWRVFGAALICAVLSHIGGGGQGMRKMLSGAFLVTVLLSGVLDLDFSGAYRELDSFSASADAAVEEGKAQAEQMKFAIITEQCEAYILDKAAELGADISVSVTLEPETGLPRAAAITGTLTPWERQTLSGEITQALGIEKEALDWKG